MRNQTELMRSILTNETAQKIIDYVSPIYGNSYVGLWLFQAIGVALSEPYRLAYDLRYETNAVTSVLLLDLWENHYGLPRDPSLTTEQRQNRIMAKIKSRGGCNPAKLAEAVSDAVGGLDVQITENVAQNTFLVTILGDVESLDAANAVIGRMKPAHLIYRTQVTPISNPTATINAAVAITHCEMFSVPVVASNNGADDGIYVDGNTLVVTNNVVQVDEGTALFGGASIDGQTLVVD